MGFKIILTGLVAVLFSTFILAPIVFRSIELVNDQQVDAIIKKISNQSKVKRIPKIYQIRTAQLNAVAFFIVNKPCIGLTTGLLEAYQNHQLDVQDLECIFAHLLSYHKSRNTFKRNLMYGIASLYNSMSYISLFLGWGFLRMVKITEQRISRVFAWILGYFFIFIGNSLRIPEKLGSILAAPLIFRFQENADSYARKIAGPVAMKETLQKINEYNQKIDRNLSILPDSEYWFIQPVKLLRIDQLFLFRPSFERRIQHLFSL